MKNTVYIQIDEDIASVIQRLKHFKESLIHLVIPKKSILFQSSVNLSILKRECEQRGNELVLMTNDPIGKNLAKNAGVKVQNAALTQNLKPLENQSENDKENSAFYPIQARRNEVIPESPRLAQKKVTIGELIQELREKKKVKKEHPWQRFNASTYYSKPVMLSLIFFLSLGMFFLISYIALPASTIFIRPAFEPLSHSINVVLADRARNENLLNRSQTNIIPAQIIQSTAKETRIFNTTGKNFNGVNASGKVTVINTATEEWELVQGTRFKTPEGLIFRSQKGIIVPAAGRTATGEILPGKLSVAVEADEFDLYTQPVGDRGNIEPTLFSIPGLSSYNQKRIWAESSTPMTGGVSSYSVVVTAENIEMAKKQIEENLILIAKEELQARLDEMNQLNQTQLTLLNEDKYISTSLQEIKIPENLEGSNKEKFEVYAEVLVEGIAYDGDVLAHLLQKELEKRAHPDMMVKEKSIDLRSAQYDFVDENLGLNQLKESGQIKLTITVNALQEYVIDSSMEAGLRFSEQVKKKVLNLPVADALAYVNNLPEVEVAEIKMWPLWLKKMPRLSEKIKVELLEE